ncbi:MAG TPA: serine/threonine-protein kinase [Vicinamibacterales bacterium]
MTPPDSDRWRLVSPYLDRALDFEDETERESWLAALQECEPAIAAELRAILGEHRAIVNEQYLEGGAPSHAVMMTPDALTGRMIGAYTLVSPIGQGGMSSVWLAERSDGRFERRVAVKFLSIALGRSGEARFRREGTILGRLTHANIAQLIDAGVSSTDQAYLILEYVEGQHIDQYCGEHALDTNSRVLLFLDVLAAVAHAHATLIVHRDLKPSNVLVDRTGRIKLLDFGIAKLIESEGTPGDEALLTRESGAALTPAYAAPEQLTGEPITTATDVYALGVLLYVLVTGEHPSGEIPTSAASVMKAVVETAPQRLPGSDLGTILGKALKKSPQERYASVTAFADDLRRYLNHEPIAARPDSVGYRVAKFVRRHRVGVLVAASVVIGLTVALYAVDRQRAIAQRRFTEVRQLSARLFDIDVRVRRMPGSSTTRQFIVDTSLDYLRQLAADAGDDPDLALDVGTAYMRVARVEGVPISPNLGQADQAEQHLRTADSFIARVLSVQPGNRTALLRSAQIAHDRMLVAGQKRQVDEAFTFGQVAGQRLERYLNTGTIQAGEAEQVVITSMNVANRYLLVGRYDDAIRLGRRSIEIAKATNQPAQAGSATTVVARAELARGDLDEALTAAHDATRLLAPADGDSETRRLLFGLALIREATVLDNPDGISLGRAADAIRLLEQAWAITESVAARDPGEANSRQQLLLCGHALARLLRESDPRRALAIDDRILQRAGEVKNNTIERLGEVSALADSTYPLRALHRTAEARTRLDSAFAKLAEMKRYPGAPVKADSEAAEALSALADDEAARGELTHAIDTYQKLLDQVLATAPKPETDIADASEMSRLYGSLAAIERRAGRIADADALDARRVQIWQRWEQTLPGNPFVARQLAVLPLPR